MSRLLVEACSRESRFSDNVYRLVVFVSVARSDDGHPVTGLTRDDFRICSHVGLVLDVELDPVHEVNWETDDAEAAGCYRMSLRYAVEGRPPGLNPWGENEFYVFGIQARIEDGPSGKPLVGQTVVRVESLGR